MATLGAASGAGSLREPAQHGNGDEAGSGICVCIDRVPGDDPEIVDGRCVVQDKVEFEGMRVFRSTMLPFCQRKARQLKFASHESPDDLDPDC